MTVFVKWSRPFRFLRLKLYDFFLPQVPFYLLPRIVLGCVTVITFWEQCKFQSYSLRIFLKSSVNLFLLGSSILVHPPLNTTYVFLRARDQTTHWYRTTSELYFLILSVVFPCMLIITQLLFQQNALVFIKSTRYYNLYFLSLYS
jgi:hypothetical protein